jgi:hypothetical protein
MSDILCAQWLKIVQEFALQEFPATRLYSNLGFCGASEEDVDRDQAQFFHTSKLSCNSKPEKTALGGYTLSFWHLHH